MEANDAALRTVLSSRAVVLVGVHAVIEHCTVNRAWAASGAPRAGALARCLAAHSLPRDLSGGRPRATRARHPPHEPACRLSTTAAAEEDGLFERLKRLLDDEALERLGREAEARYTYLVRAAAASWGGDRRDERSGEWEPRDAVPTSSLHWAMSLRSAARKYGRKKTYSAMLRAGVCDPSACFALVASSCALIEL